MPEENGDRDSIRRQAALERALSELADVFPSTIWRFYTACKREGFSEDQAFSLTQDWFEDLREVTVIAPIRNGDYE